MDSLIDLPFNPAPPSTMHMDINSCFATIEQQANPHLRNKPVAVAAYNSPNGCILAASVQAKQYGIKTGMRVKDGKTLCPGLIVRPPDPWKYRNIHLKLRTLLQTYTDDVHPKSIDEFVLQLKHTPSYKNSSMQTIAKEIKQKIKDHIGDYITVSVGISTNRYLAKIGAGLKKPDGLDEINKDNYKEIFSKLELKQLTYIKDANERRLNRVGIFTTLDFHKANISQLKWAFQSVTSYYWYLRLRGWEIDSAPQLRRTYGNSYSLPKPLSTSQELAPILHKLVEKMSGRMRKAGYKCRGVHLSISYRNHLYWHKGMTTPVIFDARDVFQVAYNLLQQSPYTSIVRNLAVSCFNLIPDESTQLELFRNIPRQENLVKAIDTINERWGQYMITPASMMDTSQYVPDRIAFGGVKELEEFSNT